MTANSITPKEEQRRLRLWPSADTVAHHIRMATDDKARWVLSLGFASFMSGVPLGMLVNELSKARPQLAWTIILTISAALATGRLLRPKMPIIGHVLQLSPAIIIVGFALAALLPRSASAVIATLTIAVLAGWATLAAQHRRENVATTLVCLSITAVGTIMLRWLFAESSTAEKVVAGFLSLCAFTFGPLGLWAAAKNPNRSIFKPGEVRSWKRSWSRAGALGLLILPASYGLAVNGDPLDATVLAVGGLSWFGATTVLVLSDERNGLAGALLVASGFCTLWMVVTAFVMDLYPFGLAIAPLGAAMFGRGIGLLNVAGVLASIRQQFVVPPPTDEEARP